MDGENSDLVLTLQSSVAYGHVGNASAAFALQRLGQDVVRIDTVRFSNHPKHGGFAGGPTPAAEIDALIEGLEAKGFLAEVGGVLSGYLGTAGNAGAVARAVAAVRRARPDAIYCLDPVIGDAPVGRFVAPDIPPAIRAELWPLADIATPNAFELGELAARTIGAAGDAVSAARALQAAGGPALIVVTGLAAGADVATVAVTADAAWRIRTPRVDAPAHGAGDLFGALFMARYLGARRPERALALAASAMHAVFSETAARGRTELALIEAQDALVNPPYIFPVEEI